MFHIWRVGPTGRSVSGGSVLTGRSVSGGSAPPKCSVSGGSVFTGCSASKRSFSTDQSAQQISLSGDTYAMAPLPAGTRLRSNPGAWLRKYPVALDSLGPSRPVGPAQPLAPGGRCGLGSPLRGTDAITVSWTSAS